MKTKKVMSREDAAKLLCDGDTLALVGNGGGVMEARMTLEAIESRYLTTGSPKNLTLVHASGIGNKQRDGITRFAHEGMVRRVIGGHWGWSPEMQQLAVENKIEAYNFSQGVICHLFREIAAQRPGLVTKTGMYTFVDPRETGGKLNDITKEDLVEMVTLGGEEYLWYKTFPINVAIIRGTTADEDGNISMEHEPAFLDTLALAQAAHNSGGKVIAQVKYLATSGSLHPKNVKVPGLYIDAIVLDPNQQQTGEGEYNPAFSGDVTVPLNSLEYLALSERKIVARRASLELTSNAVINLGFGMADGVAAVAAEEGVSDAVTMTIEQGIYGGIPAKGAIFGVASNPVAVIDECAQFDFYSGHGLDMAFLGLAQVDQQGNVNVSKFGKTISGSGGFIDISQSAKKLVFCGTFMAGGLKISIVDGKVDIVQEGKHRKFVKSVEHKTFSAEAARHFKQKVTFVTERAVFVLTELGLLLTEIAPGIDLNRDIIDQMDFVPNIAKDLKIMDPRLFREEKMGLTF
jgi:propionate CoA-transferase